MNTDDRGAGLRVAHGLSHADTDAGTGTGTGTGTDAGTFTGTDAGTYADVGASADGRRALVRVAAEAAELAGWLAFDTGELAQAERHCRHALALARSAGDPALAAWAMGNIGRTLTYAGLAAEACEMFQAACDMAAGLHVPRLDSWLSAASAWNHAVLGRSRECAVALAAAERHLGAGDDDSFPWLDFYGYAQLDNWTGRCQLAFGRGAEAALSFRTALRLLPARMVRERASTHAELGDAYAHQGDVDAACASLRQAYAVATRTGSLRIEKRIRRVRLSSLRRREHSAPVRDLDELLDT